MLASVSVRVVPAAQDEKSGLDLAITVAEVVLALTAGNIREVCGGTVDRTLSPREWRHVATGMRKAIDTIHGASAIGHLVDANACRQNWEKAGPEWQHRALLCADAWEEKADQYFNWSSRTTLVDLRDSRMRVPTNPAVSTALPFNAAVEVLADGILASHKAHYSLNYSAKMGVTDATIRILVLAALRKQLAKPDAADLDACQEYRRAMNTSLMAVCGKMNFPAHLMATYMLGIRDFYVSHDFVDVHHFNYHPFRSRRKGDDDNDDSDSEDSNSANGSVNATDTCGTWIRVGGQLVMTSQVANYTSRCDPALASNDDVLWAPAVGNGFDNLKRMGVLAYRVAVRDAVGSDSSPRSRSYHIVADSESAALVQGHRQVPATKHCVAVIKPHYAVSGLKQPEIWRKLCKRLTAVYSMPCSFGAYEGHGLSCGCFAADPTEYEACGADARDRSTAVTEVVQMHVAALLSTADQAHADDLVAYCLFWWTYLPPWHVTPPGFRDDVTAEQIVCEFAATHLQWHRHRCLLWDGMPLRFEFDNDGTRAEMAQNDAPMVDDLVVLKAGDGLGIVRARLGPRVKVAMLENIPIEKQYRDKVLYKVTATERWFSEADLYGHLNNWEFELQRDRTQLDALDRDAVLKELLEANIDNRRALRLAESSDVNDDALRQLLFDWCQGNPDSVAAARTTRSGRTVSRVQRLPAGPARGDNQQDDRPHSHRKLRRSAELRVRQLRPPKLGRLVAVVDADAYEQERGSRADVAKHPLPYWLAVVHGADVTEEQWLGAEPFEVRYLEDPTPVYRDGQLHHWAYASEGTDVCFVPRENVLCQLPELDEHIANGGVVQVSEELHSRCYDAACRHVGIELRVGPHTAAVDFSGCYDVQCTVDSTVVSLAARSQGLCSKVLTGLTMQLRLPNVRLYVWPWHQPTASQRAVLTLPNGAKAHGTLQKTKMAHEQASNSSCQPVSFEAAVGRGADARYNLDRLQHVHGLNGEDAKTAAKDRMEQTVRDLRIQKLDNESAPPGWLRVGRDGSDDAPDEVEIELLISKAAAQFAKVGDTNAPLVAPLTASALTGLGNATSRMRAGDDDADNIGAGLAAAAAAPMADAVSSSWLHIPADAYAANRICADAAEFKRKLKEANKQTSAKPTAAQDQSLPFQHRSPGPPLTPLPQPPNGQHVPDQVLTTAHPPCRLSVAQTLRTGAPDHGLGTPFGKPMNQGQGEATRAILDALGFESEANAQVGTAAVGSKLFPAGHLKLFKIVGEPGTGKSVVLNAVRRHVISHGWTHDQYRVLAATGKAAASVHGSTFASFKGQAGVRAKVDGVRQRAPPGIQPVFDAGQKKRLRERFGRLRVIFVDEYEMLKLEDFAVSTNTIPASDLACGPTAVAYASVGLAVAQGHSGGSEGQHNRLRRRDDRADRGPISASCDRWRLRLRGRSDASRAAGGNTSGNLETAGA
jgi:hypothetical protein